MSTSIEYEVVVLSKSNREATKEGDIHFEVCRDLDDYKLQLRHSHMGINCNSRTSSGRYIRRHVLLLVTIEKTADDCTDNSTAS